MSCANCVTTGLEGSRTWRPSCGCLRASTADCLRVPCRVETAGVWVSSSDQTKVSRLTMISFITMSSVSRRGLRRSALRPPATRCRAGARPWRASDWSGDRPQPLTLGVAAGFRTIGARRGYRVVSHPACDRRPSADCASGLACSESCERAAPWPGWLAGQGGWPPSGLGRRRAVHPRGVSRHGQPAGSAIIFGQRPGRRDLVADGLVQGRVVAESTISDVHPMWRRVLICPKTAHRPRASSRSGLIRSACFRPLGATRPRNEPSHNA